MTRRCIRTIFAVVPALLTASCTVADRSEVNANANPPIVTIRVTDSLDNPLAGVDVHLFFKDAAHPDYESTGGYSLTHPFPNHSDLTIIVGDEKWTWHDTVYHWLDAPRNGSGFSADPDAMIKRPLANGLYQYRFWADEKVHQEYFLYQHDPHSGSDGKVVPPNATSNDEGEIVINNDILPHHEEATYMSTRYKLSDTIKVVLSKPGYERKWRSLSHENASTFSDTLFKVGHTPEVPW
jgi:hypothetical protein